MAKDLAGSHRDIAGFGGVEKVEDGLVLSKKEGEVYCAELVKKGNQVYLAHPDFLDNKLDKGYKIEKKDGKTVWVVDAILMKKYDVKEVIKKEIKDLVTKKGKNKRNILVAKKRK